MTNQKPAILSKDDLLFLITLYQDRHHNEDRLSSERTNIFMLSNSFLVAGFVLATSIEGAKDLALLLGCLGVFLSILQFLLMYYNFRVLRIWGAYHKRLYKSESFEHLRSADLLPLDVHRKLTEVDAGIRWIQRLKVDPNNIATYWIPIGLLAMWLGLMLIGIR